MILLITLITYFIIYHKNNLLKKLEKEELNNQSDLIENCIDIENKNKRTIYENIKLSEYCINKFGNIKRNSNMKIYKK